MVSTLKLPFSFDAERLRADLRLFDTPDWAPHFNTHYYSGDWSGIPLRAAADAHVALYPDPAATSYSDTPMMERCDYVPTVVAAFQCDLESVRFLRLGAGAEIREHRDHKLSLEDGVARVHVPVKTNEHIEFCLDGERVNMAEGEAWYLNFNLRHSVVNRGTEDRVHLVVDCIVNNWFRGLFPDP